MELVVLSIYIHSVAGNCNLWNAFKSHTHVKAFVVAVVPHTCEGICGGSSPTHM